ncbi:uncharacterized protein LOC111259272 [Varroa jacobsoni]|uniref:uncharacterized protein LOC111259272 n=1 Tax=Varroa jacobsoni TaxID=62625 RepID=UPI000BF640E7|nr:uncharacterized protein LOC111259272 [Varroa jacobsoni]
MWFIIDLDLFRPTRPLEAAGGVEVTSPYRHALVGANPPVLRYSSRRYRIYLPPRKGYLSGLPRSLQLLLGAGILGYYTFRIVSMLPQCQLALVPDAHDNELNWTERMQKSANAQLTTMIAIFRV